MKQSDSLIMILKKLLNMCEDRDLEYSAFDRACLTLSKYICTHNPPSKEEKQVFSEVSHVQGTSDSVKSSLHIC